MSKGTEQHTYDAIVIGSGISGGWAAKELCDLGVKTMVLERGRNIEHIKDYPTATKGPWEFPHHGEEPLQVLEDNPVISKCYAYGEDTHHFFVKDKEHPYIQEKPFDWIRGYQVGGKSIMWGRACQRWSNFEFSAPQRFGYAIDLEQGRGQSQARELRTRGCPFGGYFSSVSSTLPWAKKTGNLTIRPHSVVHSVIYDEQKGKAVGVKVIDALTG